MSIDRSLHRDFRKVLPPDYFELIRKKTQVRWEQLEADPELAAPWHQLFKQVQSPRHVLSELLQNADDAGATEACVDLVNGEFVFTHNGKDFIDQEFASLCRFGYSNKRSLHTIGFRGIGFKSTFSLGDKVHLHTPTLSVAFLQERFSEPVWIGQVTEADTQVRVKIKDQYREQEIRKNLDEWLRSPASLLFFDSIRRFRIGSQEVHWNPAEAGPVPNSVWMVSSAEPTRKHLLIRSGNEYFPKECINEIRQERMVSADDEMSFPPCRIELVLGMEGRLYVILPTGVKTNLPFACNAPFIQDPARVKIKDPETSPTNRWLLSRAGALAAEAMVKWLERDDLSISERCDSYALLPSVAPGDNSIEGVSGTIVEREFKNSIEDTPVLLTEDSSVVRKGRCVSLPALLLSVWDEKQLSHYFDSQSRPLLSSHIQHDSVQKLVDWKLLEQIRKSDILDTLEAKRLPTPDSWKSLLILWGFISEEISKSYFNETSREAIRVIPVHGSDQLHSANEVVRLGDKKLLHAEDDWQFLMQYMLVLNQDYLEYIANQEQQADSNRKYSLKQICIAANKILESLSLNLSTDVDKVIETVSKHLFQSKEQKLEDYVRLTQIAAKLGAQIPPDFKFVTKDGMCRNAEKTVIADLNWDVVNFVDENRRDSCILHERYSWEFISCTENEWKQWILSGKSGMHAFLPLEKCTMPLRNSDSVRQLLKLRAQAAVLGFPYKTNTFEADDWDFSKNTWDQWRNLAESDSHFWAELVDKIIKLLPNYVNRSKSLRVYQVATTGRRKPVTSDSLSPGWIMKLRDYPCLRDVRGHCHKPAELLRRTPETESLLGVENFVDAHIDTEQNRIFLDLLGVGSTPTGPERLLERLRALAGLKDVPIYELEKWYRGLDQMLVTCNTDDLQEIRKAFNSEPLILTQDEQWLSTDEVFLHNSDDVPGVPIVHPSVQHLSMWLRIGINERPTEDLVLKWLQELPSGKLMAGAELKRARTLLSRFPYRIWDECQHWLSLDGCWTEISSLDFCLTMQSLAAWSHLFSSFKHRTADFRGLEAEVFAKPPFSNLPTLVSQIEDRFENKLDTLEKPSSKQWIGTIGNSIKRIEFENEENQESIHQLGEELAGTLWQVTTDLESVPYINGVPAGTARKMNVLWKGKLLYVEDRPMAQLFKSIAQEIARPFDRRDLSEAIQACVDRSAEFIEDYFSENFVLSSPVSQNPVFKVTNTDMNKDDYGLEQQFTLHSDAEDPENLMLELGNDDVEVSSTHIDSDLSRFKDHPIEEEIGTVNENDFDMEVSTELSPYDHQDDDIDFDDDIDYSESDQTPADKSEPSAKSVKPQLIDLFMAGSGYTKNESGQYLRNDGSWVEKSSQSLFPWEEYSAEGDLIQSYWVKDCCLEATSLQLNADIWNMCERQPNNYSIVLCDHDDNPVVYPGQLLIQLRDQQQITIHPASFRLVYHHTDDLTESMN